MDLLWSFVQIEIIMVQCICNTVYYIPVIISVVMREFTRILIRNPEDKLSLLIKWQHVTLRKVMINNATNNLKKKPWNNHYPPQVIEPTCLYVLKECLLNYTQTQNFKPSSRVAMKLYLAYGLVKSSQVRQLGVTDTNKIFTQVMDNFSVMKTIHFYVKILEVNAPRRYIKVWKCSC